MGPIEDLLFGNWTKGWLALSAIFIVLTGVLQLYWLTLSWVFLGASHLCDLVFDEPRASMYGIVMAGFALVFVVLSFVNPAL